MPDQPAVPGQHSRGQSQAEAPKENQLPARAETVAHAADLPGPAAPWQDRPARWHEPAGRHSCWRALPSPAAPAPARPQGGFS